GTACRNSSCTLGGREVESPLTYSSCVSSPSGSRKIWWRGASGNFTILSSTDGQYRGPRPLMAPPYSADSFRWLRMISFTGSPAPVIQQGTWRGRSALSKKENRYPSSSPSCRCTFDQSTVRPSIRGGVPVLKRC